MTSYSVAVGYQRFGGNCFFHLQGEGLPKRWYSTATLHGVTTQKSWTWIFTTVETSNLVLICNFCLSHRTDSRIWKRTGVKTSWSVCYRRILDYLALKKPYLLHGVGYYLKSWLLLSSSKISRFLTEPEGSLPCSQKPAVGPFPEPAESSSPHRSLSPQGPARLNTYLVCLRWPGVVSAITVARMEETKNAFRILM
jgi:hypothetical protein